MGTTTILLTDDEPRLADTEQVKHTPTPWRGTYFRDGQFRIEAGSDGSRFLVVKTTSDTNIDKANALFIVRAVNVHAYMLAALRTVGDVLSRKHLTKKDDELWAAFSQVVAAIFKAEGRAP